VKSKNSLASFKFAVDGILHAYRTQRHFRFHFWVVIAVLVASRLFNLDRHQLIMLIFSISLVLVCEMFNTALEAAVDLFTDKYHPLAKHAKDIAAGAVLIATLNAIAVGSYLFIDEKKIKAALQRNLVAPYTERAQENPQFADLFLLITLALTILMLAIFMWKVKGRKGTFLKGGVVSGHSALAFFFACVIGYTAASWSAAFIGFLLALLVSQSRIEGNIHTLQETIFGAVLGILVTLLMFQILPRLMVNFVR
jgi:diacylglycerol kinase (ATP)